MKKGDIIIISAAVLAVIASFSLIFFAGSKGQRVTVKENNEQVYEGSLFTDKEIKLSGNTVVIKNGKVSVKYASCKNQICKNHRAISKKGESIICLPNKVVAEIE